VKNTRVLIVDDEPGIRESLRGVLEDEGCACEAVESGEQCIEELQRHAYDVVLLDVWLPGMDGLETLARIQEIPFMDRPEVVVISGHGTIETAVKATLMFFNASRWMVLRLCRLPCGKASGFPASPPFFGGYAARGEASLL